MMKLILCSWIDENDVTRSWIDEKILCLSRLEVGLMKMFSLNRSWIDEKYCCASMKAGLMTVIMDIEKMVLIYQPKLQSNRSSKRVLFSILLYSYKPGRCTII